MADQTPVYTLHYFPFSLYSLMARFGIVIGQSLNAETAPKIEIKLVNMHRDDNLSEEYLTSINSKGQIPALSSPALPSIIADSHDISNWLCQQQPELVPDEHRETIKRLVEKIYSFHAKALLIPAEKRKDGVPNDAARLLENPDITEGHRQALEKKNIFHKTVHSRTLEPDNVAEVESKARDFIADLEQVLGQRSAGEGPWIFGNRPTIIDAHATPLLARLLDVKRDDLVPDAGREYVRGVLATPEWDQVTHGRRTLWDVSLGHVADFNPL